MSRDEQEQKRLWKISGREHSEALFSRTIPLRKTLSGGKSFVEADARTFPAPNQPPVSIGEEGATLQDRNLVSYRKSGSITATTEALPSPETPLDVQPLVCPTCKNRGWLRQNLPPGHPDFGKITECVCLLERRRTRCQKELVELSNLSEEQREQTLHTFFPHVRGVLQAFRSAKQLAFSLQNWGKKRAVGNEGAERALRERGIVLIGERGVGKTHLALSIANMALDVQIVVLFVTVPDLLDYLRATFSPDAEVVYATLFERLRNAHLLVLDDLGTQRSSPWADEKLFQLINHRYNYRLPTVITINEKAWTYLDDRLQSRLSDQSFVEVVRFKGAQDYRPKQMREALMKDDSDIQQEEE